MQTARSTEQHKNKFFKVKIKIATIKQDIEFIKKCKVYKVFPSFIKIKTSVINDRTNKVMQTAKIHWLKLELAHHYATLGFLELEAYNLHLTLTRAFNKFEWDIFYDHLCTVVEHKTKLKIETHKRKFDKLYVQNMNGAEQNKRNLSCIDNVVYNKSSTTFTPDELCLLNKGLKFAIPPVKPPIEDLVTAIQCGTTYTNVPAKQELLLHSTCVLREAKSKQQLNNEALHLHKIIKNIKSKNITVSKADKGNSIVILDYSEYLRRMELMLSEGDYTELNFNPLNKMRNSVHESLNKYCNIIGKSTVWKLKNSNPQVPRLYGLPKIHKPGDSMRPIVSNINAPTQKISKWLIEQFSLLEPPPSLSVKNSIDFVNKVKDLRITRNEMMVSFDVKSLFPSIPINKALDLLKKWLVSRNIIASKCDMYIDFAKLCMDQNIFQFNEKFYRQNDGTAMGNSLSGFLAEIFMSNFEMDLKNHPLFPRVWYRYVDDIFAVCSCRKIDATLNLVNNCYNSIQFTRELESNNQLPFLDIMISRLDNSLDFKIYRKDTFCERLITADSFHHHRHKMAGFHSMVHRLLSIPMSTVNYETELNYIYHLAQINGYYRTEIDSILRKHLAKKHRSEMSSFFELRESESIRRIGIPYYPIITNKLAPIFRKHDFEFAPKSLTTLKSLLGSTKDKIPFLKKSGIYEISCQSGCDALYYGKTIRNIETRFSEHMYQFKNKNIDKSSVAKHLIESQHKIDISNIRLVQEVNNNNQIEIIEAIHIRKNKHKNLMNADMGNIQSPLINIF